LKIQQSVLIHPEVNAKKQGLRLSSKHPLFKELGERNVLTVHDGFYGLNSGYVTDLKVNMSSNADLDGVYQLKF
jgi:carbonic anhydrase